MLKRLLASLVMLLSLTGALRAQQFDGQSPANIASLLYASNFAQWTVAQGNNGPFSWSSPQVCTSATSGGVSFKPFVAGSPIRIMDTATPSHSENVTVTAVSIIGSGCSITTTTPAYQHYSFYLTSATQGLQESINYALQVLGPTTPAAVVYVTPAWSRAGGVTGEITGAQGSTLVTIWDQRTSCPTAYTWNGTNYVGASLCAGGISLTTTGTSGPATLVGDVLNIPVYSGGGGSGLCPPDGTQPGTLLAATNVTGTCEYLPANYNVTLPGFSFSAPVTTISNDPPINPFLTFSGNSVYTALYNYQEQDVLPGDVVSSSSPQSYLAYIQWEDRYPGFYGGEPTSNNYFAYSSTGMDLNLLSYDAAITTAFEIQDDAYKPGDTLGIVQFENWESACQYGSDECDEAYRLQMTEVGEWIGTVVTGGSQATTLTFARGANGYQTNQLDTPLVDLTGEQFGTLTVTGSTSINQTTDETSNPATGTVSGFTVNTSTSGVLLQPTTGNRLAPNTTGGMSHTTQTFNVAIASNPNGELCYIAGPRQIERIRPTATLVSTGIYSLTAPIYWAHQGGTLQTITLGAGGTGWAVNDTFTINQAGTNGLGMGKIVTESGGVATSITVFANSPGPNGYFIASGLTTTATSPSTGAGLTVNITAISGTQINCGGSVGGYLIQGNSDSNGSHYAVDIISATNPSSVVIGYQAPARISGEMITSGGVGLVQGGVIYSVIDPATGLPDGGQLAISPNNGAWTDGDAAWNLHAFSAGYTGYFINDNSYNPTASRQDIVVNRIGHAGGQTANNAIFRFNDFESVGSFQGGGGSSINAAPPLFVANGPINSVVSSYYVPLTGGGTGVTSGQCGNSGIIFCFGTWADPTLSSNSTILLNMPEGEIQYTETTGSYTLASFGPLHGGFPSMMVAASAYQIGANSATGNAYWGDIDIYPFAITCLGDTANTDVTINCNDGFGVGALAITSAVSSNNAMAGIQFGAPVWNGSQYWGDVSIQNPTSGNLSLDVAAVGDHLGNLTLNNLIIDGTCTGCGSGGSGSVGTAGQVQMVGSTAGSFAASHATDNGTTFAISEPTTLTDFTGVIAVTGGAISSVQNTTNCATCYSALRVLSDSGDGNFVGFYSFPSSFTPSLLYKPLSSYLGANSSNTNGLIVNTETTAPLVLGTDNTAALTINGSTQVATFATGIVDSALTSGNCVQASTGGLLTTTGSACGSGGGGPTLQTNSSNNSSQSTLNFETSTTNATGLTITPSNPSGGIELMEATGIVNAAHGGTGISTASSTGCPSISSGTWSVGTCYTGVGTIVADSQYDVPYYSASGSATTISGAAIAGFQFDSTSGVPAAATATNLGALAAIAQYDVVLSGGTTAALVGLAPSSTSGLPLLSQGASSNPAYAALALTALATESANTVVGNATAGSAAPTALAMPSCSGATNALIWTTSTGFGCNTISGGSTAFSALTSGTNTTAAMLVGSGATLGFTGSGTINASTLLSGTWAIPGAIGSTTPNTGAFSTLTDTALTTSNAIPKNSSAGLFSESLATDTGTIFGYTGTGGYTGVTFTSNGTTAGFLDLPQGTTSASVAPCNTATSICFQAPTSVTSQLRTLAGTPATGFTKWTNTSGSMVETIVPITVPVAAAISSATGGSGTGTVTCLTAACTNISGTYSVAGGTFTTGTFLTLVWPTTTTAYNCWATQNGSATALGVGNGVATATGMAITNAVTIFGVTVTINYGCSAL